MLRGTVLPRTSMKYAQQDAEPQNKNLNVVVLSGVIYFDIWALVQYFGPCVLWSWKNSVSFAMCDFAFCNKIAEQIKELDVDLQRASGFVEDVSDIATAFERMARLWLCNCDQTTGIFPPIRGILERPVFVRNTQILFGLFNNNRRCCLDTVSVVQ
jgi:hypothetical protein